MLFKSKNKKSYPSGLFTTKGSRLSSKRKKVSEGFIEFVSPEAESKSKNQSLEKFLDTSFVYYDQD